ncbi:glycosyltransferase [archaeon]|nr:glycosyltransferase [archaeon]NDB54383.1 glycosyltransferase [archaeon]
MLDVNSKILWLADYNLTEAYGGAQRSDQIIIDQGRLLGYNILKVTSLDTENDLNINNYDVVISSNIHALTNKHPNLIDDLYNHPYHIRLEHDSNEYLSQENRIKLFANCKKTIFLSDFHYSFFKNYYGDIFKNVEIIYDPIDLFKFKNNNDIREEKVLYAGYLHPLKGTYEFFDFVLSNPDKNFVIVGWASNNLLHYLSTTIKNVEYLGTVNYDEMPEIYNKYKYMFYSPNLNEPFCRSIAEAVLCGMQIITDKSNRIGCLLEIQKNGIDQFREKCNKAGLKFWQTI